MPRLDPAAAAAKWSRNAQGSVQDYLDGVATTDVDPTARAIAAKTRLLQRFTDAVNSGKWEQRLRAKGKAGWQAAVAAKGGTNYATGVQAAEQDVAAAFSPLFAHIANLQRAVDAMPNNTDADRNNRMVAFVNGMRQYRRPG